MIEALEGYFVFVALGVLVIGVATWFALRHPPARSRGAARSAAPSYGVWFGILLAVVLAVRGSLSVAGLLLVGVIVYAAVVRLRLNRGDVRNRR